MSILTESSNASRIGCTHSGYLGAENGALERRFEVGLEVEWVMSRKSTKRRFPTTFMSEKYILHTVSHFQTLQVPEEATPWEKKN